MRKVCVIIIQVIWGMTPCLLVPVYQLMWCCIPEDLNLYLQYYKNVKSYLGVIKSYQNLFSTTQWLTDLYFCSRFSREEQLLWERRRVATWGITSYELHQETGKLVFPAASSLFQCLDTGFMVIKIIKDKDI